MDHLQDSVHRIIATLHGPSCLTLDLHVPTPSFTTDFVLLARRTRLLAIAFRARVLPAQYIVALIALLYFASIYTQHNPTQPMLTGPTNIPPSAFYGVHAAAYPFVSLTRHLRILLAYGDHGNPTPCPHLPQDKAAGLEHPQSPSTHLQLVDHRRTWSSPNRITL